MQYFFQDTFTLQVKNLLKNNSYQDCELAIIDCVFKLSLEQIMATCSAMRINASSLNPIAKLRINFNTGKSSSYRLYVFALIKNEKLYFAYLYPKTGTLGQNSLKPKQENEIIKELLRNVKSGNLQEVYLDKIKNKICNLIDSKEVF